MAAQLMHAFAQGGSKLVKQPSQKVARFAVERLPLYQDAWGFVKVPVSSKRHLKLQRPQDEVSELQHMYEAALLEEEEQRAALARQEASMSCLAAIINVRETQQHAAKRMLRDLEELQQQAMCMLEQQPMLDFQEEVFMCGRQTVPLQPGGDAVQRPGAAWHHQMVDDMTHHIKQLTGTLKGALVLPAPAYSMAESEPPARNNVLPFPLPKGQLLN